MSDRTDFIQPSAMHLLLQGFDDPFEDWLPSHVVRLLKESGFGCPEALAVSSSWANSIVASQKAIWDPMFSVGHRRYVAEGGLDGDDQIETVKYRHCVCHI